MPFKKSVKGELLEKQGEDVFVAAYSLTREESGELFSYSVWSEGVDSALPRTDKLMLYRPEIEQHMTVLWSRAAPIVGDLLLPIDIYPARFRAREFPSERQLRELREVAGANLQ